MIPLETLNSLLGISESEMIDGLIVTLMASPQLALFFEKLPSIKKALMPEIPRWKTEITQQLRNAPIPAPLQQELYLFRLAQTFSYRQFSQQLPELITQLEAIPSPFLSQAQELLQHSGIHQPSRAQHALFLQRWRLSLTLQALTLNERLLEQQQEQLMADLQQRMILSGKLVPLLTEENETAAGRLWDMSKKAPRQADYQLIGQYADFLATQPELRQLAQQLGRSQQAMSVATSNASMEPFHQWIREPDTVPQEISGLHQSDDILRLLPPELATLGISELEMEFYRRLVEKRLLTYRLKGDNWHKKVTQRPVTHQHHQRQPRGPFIVCVDTSGSMGGFNERCAKAFCLALLNVALADDRACYIMLFAHEVICYELTAEDGPDQIIRFLSQRFRGGTDLTACLNEVLKQMNSPRWQDADAVVISDFIAQRLPESLIKAVHNQQQRFHAVAISDHGKPNILKIFDHVWRFDTGLKSRLLRRWRR